MSCIYLVMFIFYHLVCVQDMNSSVSLFLMAFSSSDHAMQNKSSEMPPPQALLPSPSATQMPSWASQL